MCFWNINITINNQIFDVYININILFILTHDAVNGLRG